jgi:hypothetical protein
MNEYTHTWVLLLKFLPCFLFSILHSSSFCHLLWFFSFVIPYVPVASNHCFILLEVLKSKERDVPTGALAKCSQTRFCLCSVSQRTTVSGLPCHLRRFIQMGSTGWGIFLFLTRFHVVSPAVTVPSLWMHLLGDAPLFWVLASMRKSPHPKVLPLCALASRLWEQYPIILPVLIPCCHTTPRDREASLSFCHLQNLSLIYLFWQHLCLNSGLLTC